MIRRSNYRGIKGIDNRQKKIFKKVVKKKNFKIYDLRNIYTSDEMKRNKINYYSIGRPDTN